MLYGAVDGIPSSPGTISISPDLATMKEMSGTLSSGGVLPNWWVWKADEDSVVVATEGLGESNQMGRAEPLPSPYWRGDSFQKISVSEGRGGIARSVFTESPGQYEMRLKIMVPPELEGATGDWGVIVKATPILKEELGAVPFWVALGEIPIVEGQEPLAVFNAGNIESFGEWIEIAPPQSIVNVDERFGAILLSVEVSGTGDSEIGIAGLSVRRTLPVSE